MAGTDVQTGKSDTNIQHDHSYYGNSCSTEERGGLDPEHKMSPTSCSTRVISSATSSSDPQNIGVYYNYQAATSGSGASAKTDNMIVPDSSCPLGWQMPYDGTGGDYYNKSKSWKYLNSSYPSSVTRKDYPISIILSGHFNWDGSGGAGPGLYWLEVNAYIWSQTVFSSGNAYWTDISTPATSIGSNKPGKTNGPVVRCVWVFTSFHRRHGGRNT